MNTIEQVRLGVTELHVSSFERSLPFYTDILGFTLLEQTDSTVTLGSNAKEPILVLKEDVQLKEKPDHDIAVITVLVLWRIKKMKERKRKGERLNRPHIHPAAIWSHREIYSCTQRHEHNNDEYSKILMLTKKL